MKYQWELSVGEQKFYFDTKEEAIKEAKDLMDRTDEYLEFYVRQVAFGEWERI